MRLQLRSLRWKIILPYSLLVLVLAGLGTYLTTQLVTGSLGERFDNQLVQASRMTADAFARKEDEQLTTARAIVYTQGLAAAIRAHDAGRIAALTEGVATNARIERLEILDEGGSRLRAVELKDRTGLIYTDLAGSDVPAAWEPVQRLIAAGAVNGGEKHAGIVTTSGGFVLYTAAPVIAQDGLAGVVLVGTSLASIAEELKASALADLTLYGSDGTALVSTFVAGGDRGLREMQVGGDALTGALSRQGVTREHRDVAGRGYDFVYGTLVVDGEPAGLYSAALSTDFIFSAAGSSRWQMALLFSAGMLAVLLVGWVLSRTITQPVLRLVDTAERVADGDFSARTDIGTGDEIGRLASCLNKMTDKLQGQYLATLRALASAVVASNPHTLGHSLRVGRLAIMLGESMELDDKTQAQLEIGGYLHDVGKIGIRDSSLVKRAAVPQAEREFIEEHPHIGLALPDARISGPVTEFVSRPQRAVSDDTGLLSENREQIIARIVAVADLYDALTVDIPGRKCLSSDEALAVLQSYAGKYLHFGTVERLSAIIPEWERCREADSGLQAPRKRRSPERVSA
ncbi:MAG: HAMP domain-containing protein [Chloroflexi bacterium]|nr:MAG: HAMP domain-containing protein [Chloroflexota bacterium]